MSESEQQRTLRVAEGKALSDKDLQRMCNKAGVKVNILMYDQLKDMNFDQLLSKTPLIMLLNIVGDNAPKVGHWIAFLSYNGQLEHFDSYGLRPDQELHITHEQPYLTRILRGQRYETNHVQLQEKKDHVNTCGRHCVSRILMKQMRQRQYVRWLTSQHEKPDLTVTLKTLHL